MDFAEIIARLKAHEEDPCITITTNKAGGDAHGLHIHLEKALGEAWKLLGQHYGEEEVKALMDRARQVLDTLGEPDERPGLALFANRSHAELVRLPFGVQERVTVGSSFFTRELLRAGLDSIHHHVLLLEMDGARLLEAQDAHLVGEVGGPFPLRMDTPEGGPSEDGEDPDLRFYGNVDAAVRRAVGPDGVVVLVAPEPQQRRFIEVAQDPARYVGRLEPGTADVPDRDVVAIAWQVVYLDRKRRDLADFARMARSAPRIAVKVDDIWAQVSEGLGGVLFVERDMHQPGTIDNSHPTLFAERTNHMPGIDLIDAIIEEQVGHGGDIRILPNGTLRGFGGIALKPRNG